MKPGLSGLSKTTLAYGLNVRRGSYYRKKLLSGCLVVIIVIV